MTDSSNGGVRRYSDLLTTSMIKTGADGRKILYPWGILGSGYVFTTNDAYERLNDLLKVYWVVVVMFIMPLAGAGSYLAATILYVLALVFYWGWMRFEQARLQRAQEKLTYRVSVTNFARLLPAWLIWLELIVCLVFVAAGMLVLIIQPGQWMMTLGGIVFFGAGVVLSAVTLVLRRRVARQQS
jgi:hypothetical protein